jgi:ribosomal-protein-alanine N-acetyltransferase
MNEAVEILPAGVRDLLDVWDLERACFGAEAWNLLEVLFALLASQVRLKAVTAAGRLVGFCASEVHAWEGVAWIAMVAVHPKFQRRGIGRSLLSAVEMKVTVSQIKLTVRVSNQAAISLYEQLGYGPVSRIARYYANGEDGLVMKKQRETGDKGGKTD